MGVSTRGSEGSANVAVGVIGLAGLQLGAGAATIEGANRPPRATMAIKFAIKFATMV